MKLFDHPIEHIICTLFGASSPLLIPLFLGDSVAAAPVIAQANPPGNVVFVWNWPFFWDFMILACIGFVGGAVALVAQPIPMRDYRDGVVRVLIAGAVTAVSTGLLMAVSFPEAAANPAIRAGVGGFTGFFSYPLVLWLGKLRIKDIIDWIFRRKPLPNGDGNGNEEREPGTDKEAR